MKHFTNANNLAQRLGIATIIGTTSLAISRRDSVDLLSTAQQLKKADKQCDQAPSTYQVMAEAVEEIEGELLCSIRSEDRWTAQGSKGYLRLLVALGAFPHEIVGRRSGLNIVVQL